MAEKVGAADASGCCVTMRPGQADASDVAGVYTYVCRDAAGNIKWTDTAKNVVTTVGKNQLLDSSLAGSSYTAAVYMGLISSVSYSTIVVGDTMASHAGWTEAGSTNAPTFTARIVTAWSAASAGAKALSAGLTFTMTAGGTLKGSFLVGASGAVSTLMNTAGTLISAGLFTGGDRIVSTSDTVTVSYTMTLT